MVSILIPYLNSEKVLARCIESVLKQTYTDLEIVLLDNGSDDGSRQLVESYDDSRIRSVYIPSRNIATARNDLIKEARGEFFVFVDSDDYLTEDSVEKLLEIQSQYDADIVCGSYTYIGKNKTTDRLLPFFCSDKKEEIHKFFLSTGRNFNQVWGKLYRKKVFQGVEYLDGKHYEDIEVLPRVLENTDKMVAISEPVYFYIKNLQSISYDSRLEVHEDGLNARINNSNFYREKYPAVYPMALAATYEFIFFFMGKLSAQKVSPKDYWAKVTDLLKTLPYPHVEGNLTVKVSRRMALISPKLAGKLFNLYSRVKND